MTTSHRIIRYIWSKTSQKINCIERYKSIGNLINEIKIQYSEDFKSHLRVWYKYVFSYILKDLNCIFEKCSSLNNIIVKNGLLSITYLNCKLFKPNLSFSNLQNLWERYHYHWYWYLSVKCNWKKCRQNYI